MPSRLIREDMLDSERVLALPIEARWLFVTIMLSADDLGIFEATAFKIARRSDLRRETVDQLLGMLRDADLVRLYEADGKRFGFIPRFRQRIQIKFIKRPLPPPEMLADDDDASNKIKALASKTTVGQRMDNGYATDGQQQEAKAKAKAKAEAIPRTPYTESKKTRKGAFASDVMKPPEVSDATWASWVVLRKAKRAPISESAIAGLRREAAKAQMSLDAVLEECCLRGWTGFRADWMARRMTAAERAAETVARLTGKRDGPQEDWRTIDADPLG